MSTGVLRTRWLLSGLAVALALLVAVAPSVTKPTPQAGGGYTVNGECNGNGGGCG